jgi:LysM repeat protein
MNRKNTIVIAVLVNAGLLAILLVAALTTQDELPPTSNVVAEAPPMPLFDELPQPKIELPLVAAAEEPVVHMLPPLTAPEPTPVPVAIAPQPPQLQEVTVKKGENLEKIAKANGTTVDQIIKVNQLTNTFLKVGQVLKLPAGAQKKTVESGPEYYTMKVGDNPWAIAMKHHMKVEELLRLNGLNEERARKLKPGDRLRIH